MWTNAFLFGALASIQGGYIIHHLPYQDASSYEQPCYEPVCTSNSTDRKAEEETEEFHEIQKMVENEALKATLQKVPGTLSINGEADSKQKVNNMDYYKEERTTGDKASGNVSYNKAEEKQNFVVDIEALKSTLQKETGTIPINEEADSEEKINNEEADSKVKVNDMDNYHEERTTGNKASGSLSFKKNIKNRSASSDEKNSQVIYKHDKKAEDGAVSYKKVEDDAEEFHRRQKIFKNKGPRATLQEETGTLPVNEEADSKKKVNDKQNYFYK